MKKLVEVFKNICKYGVELVVAAIAALLLLVSVVFGSLGCTLKALGQLLQFNTNRAKRELKEIW